MGIAWIFGTGAQPSGAHPYSLLLDGLDVIKDPAGGGNTYGAPLEDILVTEAGPDGVSSMKFTVDDPRRDLAFRAGARVVYWDHTLDVPVFSGWLDGYDQKEEFGNRGFVWSFQCVGLEVELDRHLIPSGSFPGGDFRDSYVLAAAASTPLTALTILSTGALQQNGGLSGGVIYGVGTTTDGSTTRATMIDPVTVTGSSIREAIRSIVDLSESSGTPAAAPALWTVDFLGNVRMWRRDGTERPQDYADLTISNSLDLADLHTEDLTYSVSLTQIVNAVYIKGGNAAGTGWVVAPDSIAPYNERQAYLDDPSILTSAARDALGASYLRERKDAQIEGSFYLRDWSPTSGAIHPGSFVIITDLRIGWTAQAFRIGQITKSDFRGNGLQTWQISFGGALPADVYRTMKRLTRGQKN